MKNRQQRWGTASLFYLSPTAKSQTPPIGYAVLRYGYLQKLGPFDPAIAASFRKTVLRAVGSLCGDWRKCGKTDAGGKRRK